MKLRASSLIFAGLLLWALAAPLSARQNQASSQQNPSQTRTSPPQTSKVPDAQAPNPEQPATSSPQTAPEDQNKPAQPATQEPTKKASPSPKPPVLKHRTRKAVARTGKGTHRTHKKVIPKSSTESNKVVVRNGGANEGSAQLTPATTPAQARHQRASTASLLAATDANLKRVAGRQLTPAQQSMLEEIQTYMRQAKTAAASADTNRAQTLAYKARLLSDELARK